MLVEGNYHCTSPKIPKCDSSPQMVASRTNHTVWAQTQSTKQRTHAKTSVPPDILLMFQSCRGAFTEDPKSPSCHTHTKRNTKNIQRKGLELIQTNTGHVSIPLWRSLLSLEGYPNTTLARVWSFSCDHRLSRLTKYRSGWRLWPPVIRFVVPTGGWENKKKHTHAQQ